MREREGGTQLVEQTGAGPGAGILPPETGGLRSLSFGFTIFAVHFFFVAYAMSLVAVPQSLEGQPDWLVGLVVGALGIAGMATRPLAGVWIDGGNRQRWLRIGGAGTIVTFAGFALSLNPWVMLLFRMLQGISMGLFTTSLLAMVSGIIPANRRGLGVGLYQSSNAISQMYASALAVGLAAAFSFAFVFLLGSGFAALALVSGGLVRDPEAGRPRVAPPPWREREWISRSALAPALVFLTMTTTMGAVQAFLPAFALERDLGNVGLFYTVFAAPLLLSRLLSGALSDRVGRGRLVVPALAVGVLSLALLAATRSQPMLLAVAVVYGLGFGAVQVTIFALIVDRTPPDRRGAGMATYTMAWDVGAVLGGVLLGVVIDATSYAFGFIVCALLPLLGIAIYLAVMGRGARAAAGAATGAAGDGSGG